MLSTNLHVLLFSFNQTSETVIVNTTAKSLNQLAQYIKDSGYTVDNVKVFARHTGRFGRTNKKHVKLWTDHSTELLVVLESQGYF